MERLRGDLTERRSDATLPVNAAGVLEPKTVLEHTPEVRDRYQAITRAFFFLTQTVRGDLIVRGSKGAVVNIGGMPAHQAMAATRSRSAVHDRAATGSPRGRGL
ncbi:hypothetical protein [Streptomyces fagopyri]|uniref:hypothetical protein n=1 Tax=Streptomyces fagopyri TaxID=2662397 RepID=UPI0033DBD1C0